MEERADHKVIVNPYAQPSKRPKTEEEKSSERKEPLTAREILIRHLKIPEPEEEEEEETAKFATDGKGSTISEEKEESFAYQSAKSAPIHGSDRLPLSEQLTFGSAEILTITEYLQHCSEFKGRGVRMTGKLLKRYIHSSTTALCLLADPLASLKNNTTQPVRRQPSLGGRSPPRRSSLLAPKRRLVYQKKKPPSSIGTKTKQEDSLSSLLSNYSSKPVAWIVLNPQQVNIEECVEGDLTMIIGQVVVDDDEIPREVARQHQVVKARICRSANGTDMSLFQEALTIRRQYLRAMYARQGGEGRGPGCGPPES